ncbi:MAG: N-acetylmuramoyl-L-alanine amidase [Flavobacteriales bacterium]|nr:N-acetylmuramoyl-L-alanine amidase [Flavobacteriales bacterium]
MAKLRYIVLHCTATPEGREVTGDDIRNWHLKGRGWSRVGYHYLVKLDGSVEQLHLHNSDNQIDPWEITNGVAGKNDSALHVVYAGGVSAKRTPGTSVFSPKDTRTPAQKAALERLVKRLLEEHSSAKVCGHNQLSNKACPSFDVPQWAQEVGINKLRVL